MLCTSETLHTPLIYNYCETLATCDTRLAETAVQEAGPSLRGMGRRGSVQGLPSNMPHSMVETPHGVDFFVLVPGSRLLWSSTTKGCCAATFSRCIQGLPSVMPHSTSEMPHAIDFFPLSFHRKQVAVEFHHRRLMSRHIQQWQLSTKWSKDVGWKEDLAFNHHCGTLLLKCMAGWNLVRCDADLSRPMSRH